MSHPAVARESYRFYAPRRNVAVRAIQGQMKLSVRQSRIHQQQGSSKTSQLGDSDEVGHPDEEPSRDQLRQLLELREAEHFEKVQTELRRRGAVPYATRADLPRVGYQSLARKAEIEAASNQAGPASPSRQEIEHLKQERQSSSPTSVTSNSHSDSGVSGVVGGDDEEKTLASPDEAAAAEHQLSQVDWGQFDDADEDSSSEDDSSSGDSSDDDDDDEDAQQAELMRELARIKAEREEARRRQAEAAEAARREEADRQVLLGNPLLSAQLQQEEQQQAAQKDSFLVKRRWDDDVVFRNQSRSAPGKAPKRFINDTIRSDFHRRFLDRYIK